jgi:pimeloyl-ACP methyl ester carboxylesterase
MVASTPPARQAVYNELMQAVVDSLLTVYERQGSGRVVVFLHGWGDTMASSRAFRTALSKKFEVIALDLPGFGGTQASSATWGLDDYTGFVADFLAKLGIAEPYAFIGHSNGGAMAIRGIAGGVLRAEKVVLLASAGIRAPKSLRLKMLKLMAKTVKTAIRPLPASVKERLRGKAYRTIGSDYLVAPHLQETFKRVVAEDVRGDAAQLSMPVLLVYGEQDMAAPVWYGELYHELMVDSTLVVLPGAGHFVYLDRADDTLRVVQEFLV